MGEDKWFENESQSLTVIAEFAVPSVVPYANIVAARAAVVALKAEPSVRAGTNLSPRSFTDFAAVVQDPDGHEISYQGIICHGSVYLDTSVGHRNQRDKSNRQGIAGRPHCVRLLLRDNTC